MTIVETTDSGERGMNLVAMTIINPGKEYWPSRESNSDLLFSSLQSYRLRYGARLKVLENIDGKGENAGNQHFLLSPQCFSTPLKKILMS